MMRALFLFVGLVLADFNVDVDVKANGVKMDRQDNIETGSLHHPKLESKGPSHQNVARSGIPPSPDSVSCQSIVVYYDGLFKNKLYPDLKYSAQFQIRMTSDLGARQYRLVIEGWNQTVSKNSEFYMDFDYNGGSQWCDDLTVGKPCSAPSNDNDNSFELNLDHINSSSGWDNSFHLFDFIPFNRTFVFEAIGGCTNDPPNLNGDLTPNSNLYKVCMCCGNYNPNPALHCPKSPWT